MIVKCVDFACDLSKCFYLFQNNQIMYVINSPCDVSHPHVPFVYACVCVLVIHLIAFKLAKATFFVFSSFFFSSCPTDMMLTSFFSFPLYWLNVPLLELWSTLVSSCCSFGSAGNCCWLLASSRCFYSKVTNLSCLVVLAQSHVKPAVKRRYTRNPFPF